MWMMKLEIGFVKNDLSVCTTEGRLGSDVSVETVSAIEIEWVTNSQGVNDFSDDDTHLFGISSDSSFCPFDAEIEVYEAYLYKYLRTYNKSA